MRSVGVLMAYAQSDPYAQSMLEAFRDGLAKLGWREGDNLRLEVRWGAGDAEKFNAFAKELVGLRPEVIASMGTIASGFVIRETTTIPIVFVGPVDAVGSGLVTNLAHPGGNVTGFMMNMADLRGKWLELLKEIAPSTKHLALLEHPATGPSLQLFMPSIQMAAQSFDVAVTAAPVQAEGEIEGVIATQAREPGGGLIVAPSAFSSVHRDLIIALAARYRIPAMYHERKFVEQGGLIAYIPDYAEGWRPAAGYVDRILKGTKPGDLPVQASAKFDLLINIKTAKALGLTVPPSLLVRADEVIE